MVMGKESAGLLPYTVYGPTARHFFECHFYIFILLYYSYNTGADKCGFTFFVQPHLGDFPLRIALKNRKIRKNHQQWSLSTSRTCGKTVQPLIKIERPIRQTENRATPIVRRDATKLVRWEASALIRPLQVKLHHSNIKRLSDFSASSKSWLQTSSASPISTTP